MEKGKQIAENEEEDNNGNGPNGGGGLSSDSDFDPTDAELLELYSKKDILEKHIRNDRIREVNIYDYNPEQLFDVYKLDREKEGYFYTPRKRKFIHSSQPARVAGNGFWKGSGAESVKPILSNNTTVGYKRRLLYKGGKRKTAEKNTRWRMLEYTKKDSETAAMAANASDMKLDDCLCKIYHLDHLKRGGTSVEISRNSQQEEEDDDQNHEILPINAHDSDDVLRVADQVAALPYGSHDNDHVDVPNSLHGHPQPQPQPLPLPLEQHNSDFGEPMQDMECAAILDALFKSFERKNQ